MSCKANEPENETFCGAVPAASQIHHHSPSLITLLNGICGFAAIVFASKGVEHMSVRQINLSYFAWSGYMIFFAMIADMLDGRVARISKTTSSFGGQLDSLCDAISFGVAPAFLMLKVLDHKLDETVGPEFTFEGFVYRFVWLAAAAYMACATIRLARFNVENEEDETAHMSFVGLPTPAAAGVLASLIVFYQDLLGKLGDAAWVDYTESVLVGPAVRRHRRGNPHDRPHPLPPSCEPLPPGPQADDPPVLGGRYLRYDLSLYPAGGACYLLLRLCTCRLFPLGRIPNSSHAARRRRIRTPRVERHDPRNQRIAAITSQGAPHLNHNSDSRAVVAPSSSNEKARAGLPARAPVGP